MTPHVQFGFQQTARHANRPRARIAKTTARGRTLSTGVMKYSVALVSALVIAGCKSAPTVTPQNDLQNEQTNGAISFLLTSAASDFHKQSIQPEGFRHVRAGWVQLSVDKRQYRLCGEFLHKGESGKSNWPPFVTIQTSGYELYLGEMAANWCKDPAITWERGDLSSVLQGHYGSLR